DLNTGKFFTTSDQLIVNHNSKLEFKFVLPYWGNFSNLTFELTIKGRNYNRTFRQNQPVFSIYDITPGEYQISVVAFDGVNKTNYKTMQLRVPTIWYKTRWFIALVVILFVLIIVLSSRIYNNYLIRKNKKLEIQIKEHVKDLENERSNLKTKKDELEKLLQFKDRVVSIISHDLIGPLRFTSTALNNINNDQNQESKSQNIEIVKSNIDNILFQTFELLTWTKFKNDSLKLQLKAIDLHQWINEIIGHFQHTNSNNIYNLVPLNCEVETETKILNIIVFNLIDNAIKYGNGDIKIEYRPKRNQHVLIIKNKGVPMDIDQRKAYNNKDFDKAFDLIKHSTTGGVGLRLCCEIIESINGAIKFPKSSADETTVLVYF
ncbi:MAG TPA: HAMP domain-containing sensor histidine kinase, partial [Bacteroidia bacterium]